MGGARVFLVEDEPICALDVQARLAKLGYELAGAATTGREALDALPGANADLVLMDIVLPGGMDGIEVAERLAPSVDVPVVYLTGQAEDDVLRRAILTGPYGYLLKPPSDRELRVTIELALHRHRAEREGERLSQELEDREDRLRESEDSYRSLMESFEGFIYACTEDYRIEYMNERFKARAGRDGTGEPCYRVLHGLDDVCSWCVNERVFRGETVRWDVQSPMDGHWYHVVNTPIRRAGRIVAKLALIDDITERKTAEGERSKLEDQLRQAQRMEAIGRLAGGIAHDFNNILTPILAHAELALLEAPEGSPLQEDLTGIVGAAERATELTRQILAISRREEEAAVVPVDLGPLVKETAKFLRASIPSTIEIRTAVDASCPPVLGDPSQLHQVLLNLCTNARDAMAEEGGVLTVGLDPAAADPGETGEPTRNGTRVALSVTDTGPGIPASLRGRIFEPYFTTKPRGKGTGLGLAVAHGIVSRLDGEIRVRNAVPRGTCFEVLLPAATDEAPVRERKGKMPAGGGQRLLVVDDEEAVRMVLTRMLQSLGYRVVTSPSGAAALEALRADPHAFDAVLTDYTMPGMTGLELAREMHRVRPDLPIVLGTGYSESVDEETVRAAGLHAFLLKPYAVQRLGETFQDVFRSGEP